MATEHEVIKTSDNSKDSFTEHSYLLPFINYSSWLSVSVFAKQRKPLWRLSPALSVKG